MTSFDFQFFTISAPEIDGRCTLHRGECPMLPAREKRLFLGSFVSAQAASQYVMTQNHYWHLTECVFCMSKKTAPEGVRFLK
jgi:hypothetical protein